MFVFTNWMTDASGLNERLYKSHLRLGHAIHTQALPDGETENLKPDVGRSAGGMTPDIHLQIN